MARWLHWCTRDWYWQQQCLCPKKGLHQCYTWTLHDVHSWYSGPLFCSASSRTTATVAIILVIQPWVLDTIICQSFAWSRSYRNVVSQSEQQQLLGGWLWLSANCKVRSMISLRSPIHLTSLYIIQIINLNTREHLSTSLRLWSAAYPSQTFIRTHHWVQTTGCRPWLELLLRSSIDANLGATLACIDILPWTSTEDDVPQRSHSTTRASIASSPHCLPSWSWQNCHSHL